MPHDPMVNPGHVDRFDGTTVTGWAFDGGDAFCTVAIFLDGAIVGVAEADQYRADLEGAGIGSGCCAFRFHLPEAALNGERQTLSVRMAGSGRELKGSPIEIIGAAQAAPPGDIGSMLLPAPDLRHRAVPHTPIAKGPNTLAPGLWIEGMKNAAGVGLYACGVFEGFTPSRPGGPMPGIALRLPSADGHLRLCQELPPLRSVLAGPLTLSFALLRREAGPFLSVEVALAVLENGELNPVWSHSLKRVLPGLQECRVRLEPEPVNRVMERCRDGEARAVLVVDLRGKVDVILSAPGIALGLAEVTDEPLRDFEDLAVRDQWPEIEAALADPPALPPVPAPAPAPAPAEWSCHDVLNVPEIVVPVFDAPGAVAECLSSLRAGTGIPHLLTLVDDGSLPETAALLDRAAAGNPWCRVLRAARNEGYTVAVNRAVKSCAGNVLVILNSDTVVTPGWLDGLLDCLAASPDTMMAGPMSNAASWQSLPRTKDGDDWAVNPLGPGESPADRARLLRSVSRRAFPEVPVLNGFCIAVRRRLFDIVGLFDELRFAAGYGEENDFCLRTADAGFRMRVADHVYVHHHKSRSFGSERRSALLARAGGLLAARYGEARLQDLNEAMEACAALTDLRGAFAAALDAETAARVG